MTSSQSENKTRTLAEAWPFADPPHRVVFKLGSNLLSTPEGRLDTKRVRQLTLGIGELVRGGTQVILVTSGAVAAGMGTRGLSRRPTALPQLQALAAIGQGHLMRTYIEAFDAHAVPVAQLLLTRGDLENRQRYLNARETIEALLAEGAVPVINENDTVTTDELTFGDNDMLSAYIAVKMSAELLVILTDIEGLFTGNPKSDPDAKLIDVVEEVTPEVERLAHGPGSVVGRGGMATKIAAARHVTRFGIAAIIASGRREGIVAEAVSGRFRGTFFPPRQNGRTRGRARAHWITMQKPRGTVTIDAGARRALLEKGSSLLPVGVVCVEGMFSRGDVIAVRDDTGIEVARGISNFNAAEIERIQGARADRLEALLGAAPSAPEIIHRDNLQLLG